MRKEFADLLYSRMAADRSVRLLTADIGYGALDKIRLDMPTRFVDFGASEQLMVGAACGMALSGLKPVCWTITPFLLYRPFEWLRNYLHQDRIPVKLVGVGRGRDYEELGPSHWACDDESVLSALPGIAHFRPSAGTLAHCFERFMTCDGPAYINIER